MALVVLGTVAKGTTIVTLFEVAAVVVVVVVELLVIVVIAAVVVVVVVVGMIFKVVGFKVVVDGVDGSKLVLIVDCICKLRTHRR